MKNSNTSIYQGADAKVSESPLANTYKLLTTDKKLTIGYIGGSITLGASAEKHGGSLEKSWVNLTSAWFKEQYPQAEIETVNAGVADTATNFGLFRLEKTLMNTNGHNMPNLVFVEFATNDWIYATQTKEDLKIQIESLFINIWQHNPYAEIVAVITKWDENSDSRLAYLSLCQHYNIPFVDVGIPLRQKMIENGSFPETEDTFYYTVDNLHPTWRGYEVYFGEIEKVFNKNITGIELESTNLYPYGKKLPAPQSNRLIDLPNIITVDKLTYSGAFKKAEAPFTCDMYGTKKVKESMPITDSYINAKSSGWVSATFSGTTLGVMFRLNSSGINMTYRIDDGKEQTLAVDRQNFAWQMYCHPQVFMLAHGLSEGEHTVQMIFSQIDDSTPLDVKLAGLLVNG